MFRCTLIFFIISTNLILSSVSLLPSFIEPCVELTPDCLKTSIQKAVIGFVNGLPEFGLPAFDPFWVDRLEVKLPGGLNLIFKNGTISGFRDTIIESAVFNPDTRMLELKISVNLDIKGQYRSFGKLLIFTINGEGDSIIKCKDIKVTMNMKFGYKMRNGIKYLTIKSHSAKHTFAGPLNFNVANLFQGNPELSKNILEFMNNNSKLVAEEFGTPFVEHGVKIVMANVKKFFRAVPADELIIGKLDL